MSWLLLMVLAGSAAAQSSGAAKRWALVIGNDNYLSVERLKNARNDAALMAQTLREANFEVRSVQDLDLRTFWRELDGLQSRIRKGDQVVVFFAGHGVQVGAEAVLLPVDIHAETEAQILREGVPLTKLQDHLRDARFALMVIDACRDNPFQQKGTRSVGGGRGLLPVEIAEGMAIIMSAGRGQKALDTVPGFSVPNGLFTFEFTRTVRTPGLDVRTALQQVRERVEDRAKQVNHVQRPAIVDEVSGSFVFFEGTSAVASSSAAGAPQVRVQSADEVEQELWNVIRNSTDPADFRDYLNRYPSGRFAAFATRQLRVLGGGGGPLQVNPPGVGSVPPQAAWAAPTTRPASASAAAAANPTAAPNPAPAAPTSTTSAAGVVAAAPLSAAPLAGAGPINAAAPAQRVGAGAEVGGINYASGEFMLGTTRFKGKFAPTGINRMLNGEGEVAWANGDKYTGPLVNGIREGMGEKVWASGQRYKGAWAADEPNGEGDMVFVNGDEFSGGLIKGVPNGKGTMKFKSGDSYTGDWVGGKAQGQGIYQWANGQRYEGPWVADEPSGKGKMRFASGDVFEGDIVKGDPEGAGLKTFSNGDVYQGQVRKGLPHGKGIMKFASGDVYDGNFDAGKPQGEGSYTWKSGDTYVGDWRGGQKHGKGVQTWKNGDKWEGEFANDQQTANGTLTRKQ